MKTIAQRVQAGIRFLDKRYGTKWRKRIDLDTLDLNRVRSCILGQTDGDYETHARKLGIWKGGGTTRNNLGFTGALYEMGSLTSAWKKALKGKVGRNA